MQIVTVESQSRYTNIRQKRHQTKKKKITRNKEGTFYNDKRVSQEDFTTINICVPNNSKIQEEKSERHERGNNSH